MNADRRAGIAALILMLVSCGLAAAYQNVSVSRTGSIEGRILNPDGAPAASLRVAVVPASEEDPAKAPDTTMTLAALAMTDASGRYVLSEIPPGRYFIVAGPLDALAYLSAVTVAPASRLNAGDLRLSKTEALVYSIRGRVIREDNDAGEEILLIRMDQRSVGLTAAIAPDGSFEFSGVRPGTYTAQVMPALQRLPATTVVVDRNIANLEIPIPLSAVVDAKVDFTVSVEGGGFMPHLTFALWNTKRAASAAQQPAEAEADTPWRNNIQRWRLAVASSNTIFLYDFLYDGTVDVFSPAFSLSMPVENYTLQASSVQLPAGYALKSARSGTTDLLKEPLRVTARGAAPVVITLAAASPPPWVKLEGRLTDLDKLKGTPTEIAILNADLPAPMTAKIGPDGRFEFPMALRGTYDVYLRPVTDSFRRTLTIDGAGVVNLEMSAVPPLMTVSGKLTGIPEKHGYEIEAALVSKTYGCDSLWGPCFQSAGPSLVTGLMDGSFAFNEVQAGDYRSLVRVCNPGSAEARRAVKPGNTVSLPAPPEWLATPSCSTFEGPPVYVTNRDVSMMFPVDSLFSMERHTRTVIGRLTLEGKPIPLRFSLQLVDSQQQATSRPTLVESSSEGTFWFKAVDGEYNVTVNLPFGATIQSFVRGNADLLKQPLRVTWANKNDVLLELSLGPKNQLSTVSGRVSGTDSARSPVNLILAGGSFSQSFETALNRDGTFAISGVPPGLYELALGGGLKRNVSGTILIGEFVADRIHRAEDVRGLEIVVPPVEDEPAILRNPR